MPEPVKLRRLQEVIAAFRAGAASRNAAEVGALHAVLIEGPSRRSSDAAPQLTGRTDTFKRVVLPLTVPAAAAGSTAPSSSAEAAVVPCSDVLRSSAPDGGRGALRSLLRAPPGATASAGPLVPLAAGDYALVRVTRAGVTSLEGTPLLRLSGGLLDPTWDAACELDAAAGPLFAESARSQLTL